MSISSQLSVDFPPNVQVIFPAMDRPGTQQRSDQYFWCAAKTAPALGRTDTGLKMVKSIKDAHAPF